MTTVSVCIPTMSSRRVFRGEALESVHNQTRQPDEIIVVRDACKEGAAVTRNKAWRLASSEYIAFLDDDDLLWPEHLERLLDCAEKTSADLVYPWFTSEKDPWATYKDGKLVSPLGVEFGAEQAKALRRSNFIPITFLVRRDVLEEVGGFPVPGTSKWSRPNCEDWGFLLKLLGADKKIVHLPLRTWHLRWHSGQTRGQP